MDNNANKMALNGEVPLVSIVITTKNEEKNIGNCLESIRGQSYPHLEVIVVDNNSTDQTERIAREYTPNFFTKGPERSAQRNYGMIEKASGMYVMYIDADMILSPILVERCVDFIRDAGASALHLPEIVLGKTYLSSVRRFERGFYDGTPIDGARFFDRSNFCQIGGFDEGLFVKGSGEDWDIDKSIKKAGGTIVLLPRFFSEKSSYCQWKLSSYIQERGVRHDQGYAGIYHNEAEFSFVPYVKKKLYYSKGFGGYIEKWGREDIDIQCQFGFFYRFWTVFTENGKWKTLISKPWYAIGMYFLRIVIGLVFLSSLFRAMSLRRGGQK